MPKRTVLSKKLVRIKAAERGMSVRQVGQAAMMAGKSDYIYRILGKGTPQIQTVGRIAEALGCSICDILEEIPTPGQGEQ